MSGRGVKNLVYILVLAGLIALHWVVLPDPSRRNWEIFPDMVQSVPRDAQTSTPVLVAGSAVDLRPPAGAIARGFMPFTYAATPEGALEAGAELANPFAADDADAIARGAEVFNTFCAVCHGPAGHGDGSVTRRGVPPPPSFLADKAMQMGDGQMYHVISLGQGNMASYASQVGREDRWRAVLHIRALQAAPSEADAGVAGTEVASPEAEPVATPEPGAEPAPPEEH